jgi:dCMP deaminase
MRVGWDEYFEAIARIVSSRSTCPRKQVGAVIVVDKRILATGYNGSRKGEAHCSDVGCDVVSDHCIRTIHAEENAVIQFTELFGWDYWDADVHIYCTLEPCGTCMRLIHQHFESPFIHWQESTEDYNRGKLQG